MGRFLGASQGGHTAVPRRILGRKHFAPVGRPVAEQLGRVSDDVFHDQGTLAHLREQAGSGLVVIDLFCWSEEEEEEEEKQRSGLRLAMKLTSSNLGPNRSQDSWPSLAFFRIPGPVCSSV